MTSLAELQKILKQRQSWQRSQVLEKKPGQPILTKRVRLRDISDFTRQLATMIGARLPLTRSLEILEKQQKNGYFKQVLGDILQQVKGGKSLSDSIAPYPNLFGSFFINMLKVAELSGNLSEVLKQLSEYLEQMNGLRRKIWTAMTYPIVIIMVAIGAVGFLIFGVLPTFTELFEDFGAEIPLAAHILMSTGEFIRSNILFLLIGLLGIVLLLRALSKSKKGSWWKDVMKFKYPLAGSVIKKVIIARFCRTLGTLLERGVSLLEALEVTAKTSNNQVIQKTVLHMKAMAAKGEPIERSITDSKIFPDLVVQMVAVGEETAELPEMLLKTAEYYENEVDASIEALTSIIEPIVIVVLGVIIGGAIITIYLQIFDLMNVIQ